MPLGAIRLVGILLLGIAIPHLTGTFGGLAWDSAWFWAVLFVTHVYETTFLINERLEDRLRLEQLERARLQAGWIRSKASSRRTFAVRLPLMTDEQLPSSPVWK